MRRKRKNNLLNLVISLGLIGLCIGVYFTIDTIFKSEEGSQKKAFFSAEDDAKAEIKLSGADKWNQVINVSIQEGDTVRSKNNKGVKIEFFEDTKVYLSEDAYLKLNKIREYKDQSTLIDLELEQGMAWVSVSRKINPRSKVQIRTPENFIAETSFADFSFASGNITVIGGEKVFLSLDQGQTEEKPTQTMIAVGQMLDFSKDNPNQVPYMITDQFRESAWLSFFRDKKESQDGPSDTEIANMPENSNPQPDIDSDTETVKIDFKIISPTNTGYYQSKTSEIEIQGRADSNVHKVIIDDWELQKFKNGDTSWNYKISSQFENDAPKGESKKYVAEAFDADDKSIAKDEIVIKFLNEGEIPAFDPDSTASASFKITKPETSEDTYKTSDELVIIEGSTPKEASKVVVNGYTLGGFKKGDSKWTYRIKEEYGNRGKPGEMVSYQAKAYDENGGLIGSDEIKILFEATSGVSSEVSR